MRDFIIFIRHFSQKMFFVRGVLLMLLLLMLVFAIVIARFDSIPFADALYFVSITALTVGYGDITPASSVSRAISVLSGFVGVIFVGLIVAVSVRALELAVSEKRKTTMDEDNQALDEDR